MKIYWNMPSGLKGHYQKELEKYQEALHKDDVLLAWNYLERAHILGQAWPREHNYVHWLMLKFGFRIKSTKEILGQIPGLIIGGVKSFVGNIPVGNTGGANVPPLLTMPIPYDLQQFINESKMV